MELFYPEIKVSLGSYTFDSGVRIEISSSRDNYSGWAKVCFTQQFKERLSLKPMDAAVISLGYEGNMYTVFSGYISKAYDDAGAANEIELKDGMLTLMRTTVTNTFMDASPQEIIRYTLAQAGVTQYELSQTPARVLTRVPVFQKNGAALLNEINSLWGINYRFFFLDGVFYWGTQPKQTAIYTFTYAENIISLERSGGRWILETVSMPYVKHSQLIAVKHPQVSGTFEVSKTVFSTNDSGFIRTYIYF